MSGNINPKQVRDICIYMRIIGISKIENLVANKIYIGSAINAKTYWNYHLYDLRKNACGFKWRQI